jgi:hypothetical protein
MKLAIAVGDIGQATKVENLAQSECAGRDGELTGEADTTVWGTVAYSDNEASGSSPDRARIGLDTAPTWRASCRGVRTAASMLFKLVSEYGSSVARVDSRTQESQRGRNDLSWFEPIGAIRPVVNDPYTQKHPKLGVTTGL